MQEKVVDAETTKESVDMDTDKQNEDKVIEISREKYEMQTGWKR